MKIYKRKGTPPIPIVAIIEALRNNKTIVQGLGIRSTVRKGETIIFVSPKMSAEYDLIFDSREKT